MARPRGGASEFIRAMPPSMGPAEVVAEGAKRGLKFSHTLVYMVRTKRKARTKTAARVAQKTRPQGTSNEADFARLVLEMGIPKMRELLDRAERNLARFIRGG